MKNRWLKIVFCYNNDMYKTIAEAYDRMNGTDDLVVRKLSFDEVRSLLKTSRHDVSHFDPEMIEKSLKYPYGNMEAFGLFRKDDPDNALAVCSIRDDNGIDGGWKYLSELVGLRKGSYGRELLERMIDSFGKMYLQCCPTGSGIGEYRRNERLADGVYRKVQRLKEYFVEDSLWGTKDKPFAANFFYCGVPRGVAARFFEREYGRKENR